MLFLGTLGRGFVAGPSQPVPVIGEGLLDRRYKVIHGLSLDMLGLEVHGDTTM